MDCIPPLFIQTEGKLLRPVSYPAAASLLLTASRRMPIPEKARMLRNML
jgi:hypothetical protein